MTNIEQIMQIPDMFLRTRMILHGFLSGIHRVPYKGVSAEFSQYREYVQGDDFRRIDFKLFRRTEKFYVKESENEINTDVNILLDISKSMDFNLKPVYSQTLMFLIAYVAQMQSDRIGYSTFSNTLTLLRTPSRTREIMSLVMRDIGKIQYAGITDIRRVISEYSSYLKRNSFVIMISDCAYNPEDLKHLLKTLRTMGNDVILFHVNDYLETDRHILSKNRLKDMETGSIMDNSSYSKRIDEFKRHSEKLYNDAIENHYDYVHFFTNEDMYKALESFFKRRH